MTDQQEQEDTNFKKRRNNLKFQILLVDKDSYLVKILNLQSLEFFEQTINTSYLENHSEINPFFETPKILIKHLKHSFQDLIISDHGSIMFYIKYSKAVKSKLLTLNLKKKQMDNFELLSTKVERIQEKFEEQLAKKEATIQQLRTEILKLQESCQQSKNIVKNLLFYPYGHPQGHQNQYFSTNFTGKSIIVNHNHNKKPKDHIFVFNHEIIVGTIKSFTLKVLHNVDILCFSFGTEYILTNNKFDGMEIVSYQTGGYINSQGSKKKTGVSIDIGDKFECELNLTDFQIKWIKNDHHFKTTILPQGMKNKSLYFGIIFSCDKQQVEIILN